MLAIACDRPLEPGAARSAAAAVAFSPSASRKNLSARRRLSLLSSALSAAAPPSSPRRSGCGALPGELEGGVGEWREERLELAASRRVEEEGGGLECVQQDRRTGEYLDEEDCCSPRESMSVMSCYSGESSARFEFYDAVEDFVDRSGSHSSPSLSTKEESELHALQLNLTQEIGRRKEAEMTLFQLQNQWHRLTDCLYKIQSPLPANHQSDVVELQIDPIDFCQEILYTRIVSEAVERALSLAETEANTKAIVDAKNYKISRLVDRVRYYEFVNREMSQRNQEIAELARKQRLSRKRRRRWMWSSIGLSVTLGVSLFACSFLGHFLEDPPADHECDTEMVHVSLPS